MCAVPVPGPVGTVPLGQSRHPHLFREGGEGRKRWEEEGGGRAGTGRSRFILTRYDKFFSFKKMQMSPGTVKPSPPLKVTL